MCSGPPRHIAATAMVNGFWIDSSVNPPKQRPTKCFLPNPDAFKAQRGQDEWVLSMFANNTKRRRRYYVDLAAQEPACNSNTFALDRRGWDGLCIEPQFEYVEKLRQVRTCKVVEAAIDATARNVSFLLAGGYGGLIGHGFDNFRRDPRGKGIAPDAMNVTSRRFIDVLEEAKAPRVIDYLSLDVEGAESRVLTANVLRRYTFLALTIERPAPRLVSRLFAHRYLFVKNLDFDAHFVHSSHPRSQEFARNDTFEQLPAKCTPHTPTRIRELYSRQAGFCNGAGYYTIYSDLPGYTGSCCYHRDVNCAPHQQPRGLLSSLTSSSRVATDCIGLKYGPPTSKGAMPGAE